MWRGWEKWNGVYLAQSWFSRFLRICQIKLSGMQLYKGYLFLI